MVVESHSSGVLSKSSYALNRGRCTRLRYR
nr:MAG TPA: hypothetical protein [Caudoviricetes sp.]